MEHYCIGIDFGTQSARGLLVNCQTGAICRIEEVFYQGGLYEKELPCGTPLKPGAVLQDPMDYPLALRELIHRLLEASGLDPKQIIALGFDSTCCTILPVDKAFQPLSANPAFSHCPDAYIKLWKHHACGAECDRIQSVIQQRSESFIRNYGDRCNIEWMIPKILETYHDSPALYEAAYRFVEVPDWLVCRLTGLEHHNGCAHGFKAFWDPEAGYPSAEFFEAVDSGFSSVLSKFCPLILSPGSKAGSLVPEAAEALGLCPETVVAVSQVDSHSSLAGVGVTSPGDLLITLGTSSGDLLVHPEKHPVRGCSGIVKNSILPGLYGYEAGQSALGDVLNWVSSQVLSKEYLLRMEKEGVSAHQLLTEEATKLKPGESGLLMLDWLNGNRSILADSELTGLILGLSLKTTPAEIYRAAIEALCFGQRIIIETYEISGLKADRIFACGGISRKNSMFMQILSDVLNREILVSDCKEVQALGAACYAAAAAGSEAGGYESVTEASRHMAPGIAYHYVPDPTSAAVYEKLFLEYRHLHDLFGMNDTCMKTLLKLRQAAGKESC